MDFISLFLNFNHISSLLSSISSKTSNPYSCLCRTFTHTGRSRSPIGNPNLDLLSHDLQRHRRARHQLRHNLHGGPNPDNSIREGVQEPRLHEADDRDRDEDFEEG